MAKAMKASAAASAHEWVEVAGWLKVGIFGCTQIMLKATSKEAMKKAAKLPAMKAAKKTAMKKTAKKPAMKAAMKKAIQATKKATEKK